MSKEEIPKSFPADVRKGRMSWVQGWEESVKDDIDAKIRLEVFEDRLNEIGINIKNSKVLEIGSGNGVFLDYLRKQGIDAFGADSRPRGETKELPIITARIEQLPFPDETFDIILSNAVFATSVYDQSHRLMMKEISRVLKHGGIYAATENSAEDIIEESIENLLIPVSNNERIVDVFRKS